MKSQNLILGLVVFFLITCSPVFGQPFEMIEIGTGADPHWSPDGKELAFVYMGSLFVANSDGEGEPQKIAELPPTASGFAWLDSNEFIVWGREYWREEGVRHKGNWMEVLTRGGEMRSIAKDSSSARPSKPRDVPLISGLTILNDGTVGYWETPVGVEDEWTNKNKIFRIIKPGKLSADSAVKQLRAVEHYTGIYSGGKQVYPERGIWLESIDGTVNKKVSSCDHCSFPVLCPDGTKILVSCGYKCAVCVLDLEGNQVCVGKDYIHPSNPLDTAFIRGSLEGMPTWSPDSRKIAYAYLRYKVISEHESIEVGSEIYVENADGTNRIQVTDTPNIAEAGPVWSPDGSKIACTDRHSAKIYVMKLK
jgi:Tol biopolymer transport system component